MYWQTELAKAWGMDHRFLRRRQVAGTLWGRFRKSSLKPFSGGRLNWQNRTACRTGNGCARPVGQSQRATINTTGEWLNANPLHIVNQSVDGDSLTGQVLPLLVKTA